MKHSVWDWDKVRYNYYVSAQPASIGGWNPLTGLGLPPPINKKGSPIGVDIEEALPLLPPDAKYVGSGPQAIGQVCRRPRPQLGEVPGNPSPPATSISPEIPAFLAGLSVGAFVFKSKPIIMGAVVLSTLLFGIAAGANTNGNGNGSKP
jgi:hypothetical protein